MTEQNQPTKSYGTSRKLGASRDIPVPIVRTQKPAATVVTPQPRPIRNKP